jgi:chromosome segregation ATPase
MKLRSIKPLILLAICFVTACHQAAPESKKFIDEINAAKVKARNLGVEADRKRREAGDNQAEHDRLIEEAAKLYGQASDTLAQAASKAKELAKVKSPSWYEEYFTLQSKLLNNLAQLAAGAKEESLIRKNGAPSESQLQTWKDQLKRFRQEDDEFRKQIASIEKRQGVVLITE